jgi:hypothetical protein
MRFSLPILIALAGLPASGLAQGVLDDIRQDVRQPAVDRSAPPGKPASHRPAADDESDAADTILGGLFSEIFGTILQGVFAPVQIGAESLGESQPFPLLFIDYPYQGQFPGFMAREFIGSKTFADQWQDKIRERVWFGRVTLDEGYDFFERVNRAGGSLLLDSSTRLGVQTQWNVLSERCACGHIDSVVLGNMNLTYRYFESRRFMMRVGAGANTLVDRYGSDWGFNFHLDSDWFLKRPFIASGVFDVGTLGSASLIHLRGTLGVVHNRYELFAGYDWLQISSTNIHGPQVGLRIWF